MEDTSHDTDMRWKKGQSGNPKGRPRALEGAGLTLTGIARTMLERPVEGLDGGRRTRLVEYMTDVVKRADAGDLKCRLFLLQAIDRGDRRKESALRNAKKTKNESLREFEEEMATKISSPMPPLSPEVEDEVVVKDVRPTVSAFAKASADEPHSPAKPWRSRTVPPRKPTATPVHAAPAHAAPAHATPAHVTPEHAAPAAALRTTPPDDASTYRRDPLTGRLVAPDGRELSWEEHERLLYPAWPHVSPHLKKTPATGAVSGDLTGVQNPVPERQAVDSAGDFGSEKISQRNRAAELDFESVH